MDLAVEEMKKNNYTSYFKKAGQKIVDLNDRAVDVGHAATKVEIPAFLGRRQDAPAPGGHGLCQGDRHAHGPPAGRQAAGVRVPEAQLPGRHLGNGTSAYSKRGVATTVPKWDAAACIQCNRCAMSCPHAAIRPVLLTEEEKASVPAEFVTCPGQGPGQDAPLFGSGCRCPPMTAWAAVSA